MIISKKTKNRPLADFFRWTGQDLNPPPPRCKRGALPDELREQSPHT